MPSGRSRWAASLARGVAYEISPSYDIRIGYRGLLAKAPSFKLDNDNFKTGKYEVISMPTLGVAYHF